MFAVELLMSTYMRQDVGVGESRGIESPKLWFVNQGKPIEVNTLVCNLECEELN